MLHRNPVAENLHQAGLAYELAGDYQQAHVELQRALGVLAEESTSLDAAVQTARIIRDDGFTDARAAIAFNDLSLLQTAEDRIKESVDTTAPLAAGQDFLPIRSQDGHDTPKLGRRELLAEHGATLGVLGRLATVRQVMTGRDTRGDFADAREDRITALQPYGLAHDILRIGNNGYYRVSNAMHGARQEILNGRKIHAAVWLGRAAWGLGWTLFRDKHNFKAAVLTTANRLRDVRDYDSARQSVSTRP